MKRVALLLVLSLLSLVWLNGVALAAADSSQRGVVILVPGDETVDPGLPHEVRVITGGPGTPVIRYSLLHPGATAAVEAQATMVPIQTAGPDVFGFVFDAKELIEGTIVRYSTELGGQASSQKVLRVGAQPNLKIDYVREVSQLFVGEDLFVAATVRGARTVTLVVTGPSGAERVEMRYNPRSQQFEGYTPPLPEGSVSYFIEATSANGKTATSRSFAAPVRPGKAPGLESETQNLSPNLTITPSLTSSDRWFYDYDIHGYVADGFDISRIYTRVSSPARNASGVYWPQVNSKANQPRSTGTNPHRGVDFNMFVGDSAGTGGKVVAVAAGKVTQVLPDSGGSYGIEDVVVGFDLNGDGNYQDTFVWYIGVDETKTYAQPGTILAQGDFIGYVDPQYAHIHIGWRNSANYDLPQRVFWSNWGNMNYGNNADYILYPSIVGRTLSVNVYGITDGGVVFTTEVSANVYWRYSSGSWNSAPMAKSPTDPKNYTYSFPSAGSIEYYIEGVRSGQTIYAYKPSYWRGTSPNSPPPEYFSAYLN